MSEWGNPLEQTSSTHAPIHNAWAVSYTHLDVYKRQAKKTEQTTAAMEIAQAQTGAGETTAVAEETKVENDSQKMCIRDSLYAGP